MSTQADVDDVIDSQDEAEELQDDVQDVEGETPEAQEPVEQEPEEVVISIGEESPPSDEDEFHGKPAPEWVKDLRKSDREKAKRIRELEQQLEGNKPGHGPVEVGSKPTLESCDWDASVFEKKLDEWMVRKASHDEEQRKKADAEKAQKDAWQAKLNAYGEAKAKLKVSDFEDAEAIALSIFDERETGITQQGVILNGADNPAMVIYALGKNPKKAKELASISDPVKFAFAVAKLETQLKVTPRKTAPVPEREVRGDAPANGASDKQLARLEAEAERTGDRSKVVAYKKQLKAKGK
jgi:hypothetical protein